VELFEATGDEEYMNQARRIANFMVANEVTPTLYGNVLYDGTNSSCGGDCSQFKGPAYRQLMRLHELDPSNTQYLAVLQASADAIWELARNPISTIFSTSWSGPAQSDVDQGRVNAACTALSRFAQQYEDYPGSGIPHNRFEAENATVHHIALAADCGDYTGWGYVGAWNADGQSVDFEVHFPAAGSYTLEFRYAAGAGNASRLIRVDGATAIPNLPFTDTGSWSVYQTRTITRQFDAGRHMISVVYDSSARNANRLNLDSLTIPNLPPDQIAFTRIEAAGTGGLLLTWNTVPGQAYRLQSNSRV
ncbi:MAG: carbohydrate-binding protein, partial [Verrucomicrobiae bacterium]|nr:carbohydrate-binding protein [Verrucomicrobiae bacterium]